MPVAALVQGEALHECGDRQAKSVLDEAVKQLAAAHEALQAFGPDDAADTQLCLEQQDFARRLLASLDPLGPPSCNRDPGSF